MVTPCFESTFSGRQKTVFVFQKINSFQTQIESIVNVAVADMSTRQFTPD